MIGQTILHHKVLEKLGEVPKWPSAFQRVVAILRSRRRRELTTKLTMIGSTISRYKILEKLGQRGMGVDHMSHLTQSQNTDPLSFPLLPARTQVRRGK